MAIKKPNSAYLQLPGRQLMGRFSLVLMMILGGTLLMMSKAGNPAMTKLRMHINDAVVPVLTVVASPIDAIYSVGDWVTEMAHLRSENVMLRNQNLELLQWQLAAKQMEAENRNLRTLLNVVPTQKYQFVTVRVVSDLGGPYVHSALINGGAENGILKDRAVINASGLLGRVIDVGVTSSRVLLLNDINSRVPVITEQAREKSILVGNNTDMPSLSYLSANSRIIVGERVVTSGDGGVFPPGIPVGVVTSVDQGIVKVQPYVDPARVEHASVIDYSF